jgi:hypothetical protein
MVATIKGADGTNSYRPIRHQVGGIVLGLSGVILSWQLLIELVPSRVGERITGNVWHEAVAVSTWLAGAQILSVVAVFVGLGLKVQGLVSEATGSRLRGAVAEPITVGGLGSLYGATGAGIGLMLAQLVQVVLLLRTIRGHRTGVSQADVVARAE